MSLKYETIYIFDYAPPINLEFVLRLEYHRHGVEHRINGPAEIWEDTEQVWYNCGIELYRTYCDNA